MQNNLTTTDGAVIIVMIISFSAIVITLIFSYQTNFFNNIFKHKKWRQLLHVNFSPFFVTSAIPGLQGFLKARLSPPQVIRKFC